MMSEPYRRIEDAEALKVVGSGAVVEWSRGVVFRCPCDERHVYVTSPPHEISFREDGVLASLGVSCGYNAREGRPQNWCHFTITDGVAKMHNDSKCPGVMGI